MSIEFKHNGRLWRTDTVDEAMTLRRKLEAYDEWTVESGEEPSELKENVWAPDTVTDLLKNAGDLQMRFLRLIAEGGSVTGDDLVVGLGLDSVVSLAGVLSGLSKQLKKLGLKPSDLYTVEVSWAGKNKTRRFRIASEFRWSASELGWPDKWP